MPHEHDNDSTLQKPERRNLLREGLLRLRGLFLPSSGLHIGDNRIEVKKDTDGVQNVYIRRLDGTEDKMSGDVPAARVFNSANISIPNDTLTTLTFNSERWDNDTIHSTVSSTGRLTATTAGKYNIVANASFASNATGRRQIQFRLNGSTIIAVNEPDTNQSSANTILPLTTQYDLAATDYVECLVFQNSGDALNIEAISNYSPEFMMMREGPSGTGLATTGTDHGGLTGLGDDDHSLYLLAAGSREGSTGGAQSFGTTGIKTGIIVEHATNAGVIIEGVALLDSTIAGLLSAKTDVIDENAVGVGVTIETVLLKDGDIILGDEKFIITGTADASDNQSTGIAGGGALSSIRGSFVRVSGNEDGNTGILFLTAGNVTNGEIRLSTAGALQVVIDDAGLVGLGLSTPLKDLHISSAVPTIRLSDSNAGTDQAVASLIEIFRGDNDNRIGFWGMGSASNDIMVMATEYAAGEIRLSTGSNVLAVTIDSSQNMALAGLLKFTLNNTTVQTDAEYIRAAATGGDLHIDVRDILYINVDTNANSTNAGVILRANASATDLLRLSETGSVFILEKADADADVANYGQIWVNTASPNELFFTDDAGNDVQLTPRKFHPFRHVVEDPISSEDVYIGFTNEAITVTEMRAVLLGSSTPSVTWTIRHGTDRSATGAEVVTGGTTTTSTTTGDDVTSFNDATIVADSHIWLETTAKSGTVDEIAITIIGTVD